MPDSLPLDSLEEQYPIEENLKLWLKFSPGAQEDEKAQILLLNIFQTLINRLKHYKLKLSKYNEWNKHFIKDVIDNLDFVNEKVSIVLERKSSVRKWDKEWGKFFDDEIAFFNNQFVDMRADATQVLIIYEGNDVTKIVKFDENHSFDPAKLANLNYLFAFFKAFTKSHDAFISLMEGPVNDMLKQVTSSGTFIH